MFNNINKDYLKKLILSTDNNNKARKILWKAIVIDVDSDGKKFETKIKGALRVRVIGIHDNIDSDILLPIVYPFFGKSGFTSSQPQIDDWVYIIYQYLEPVGQGYWISTVDSKDSLNIPIFASFDSIKKDALKEPIKKIPIDGNEIIRYILDDSTYYQTEFDKDLIVLHHTASDGDPEGVIDFWNDDNKEVATCYIIGFDGKIYQTFKSDKMWAYHLKKSPSLEKRSIGIEIMCRGVLRKTNTTYYYNGKEFNGEVFDAGYNWRDHRYFESYNKSQIKSLKDLLKHLIKEHNINPSVPKDFFEYTSNHESFKGIIGHVSVREDKTDVHLGFPINDIINDLNLKMV